MSKCIWFLILHLLHMTVFANYHPISRGPHRLPDPGLFCCQENRIRPYRNGDITTNDIPVLIVLKGPAGGALLLEQLLDEVPDEQKDYGAYEGADNLAVPC